MIDLLFSKRGISKISFSSERKLTQVGLCYEIKMNQISLGMTHLIHFSPSESLALLHDLSVL